MDNAERPQHPDQSVARVRREMPELFERVIATRVHREMLQRASWVAIAAALAGVMVAASLAGKVATGWLMAWVGAMLVQAVARVVASRIALATDRSADRRVRGLVLGTAAFAGALWGALPLLPLIQPDPVIDFYTAAVVVGVVAGTAISYASAPRIMLAIAFPALIPTACVLALRGDTPGYGAAALLVLLGVLIVRESRRNREAIERDIAQYLLLERESRRLMGRETLLRLGADALPEYIAYIDRDHRYLFVNRRYVELLGQPRDRIIGKPMREIVGDWYAYLKPRLDAALAGEAQDFEVVPPSRVPRDSHFRIRYIPDRRDDGSVRGVFAVTIEITAYKRAQTELERRAELDQQLGVLNAASFRERVAREHEMLQQAGGAHALCFVDLDGLKQINDRSGHAQGDAALKGVADILRHAVRGSDLVGRLGGDEFALLFHDCALDIAAARCRSLLEAIDAQPVRNGDSEMPLRVSIGVTLLRSVDVDLEAALARADAACYSAKHAGGHRVEVG